ncbi:Calx-beta domain-containing protein [Actinospongicola halichondriae]|uniref:Calx-beta domain-containing protein n=1 Tax=Actinospongicola halichondriae TaxID=3236844 RepID=UPI003D3E12B8
MRTTRLLTAAATAAASMALLATPASAGGPVLQDPSELPPPPPPPTITVSDATAYEADGSMAFRMVLSEPAPVGMHITTSIVHEDTDGADFVPVLFDDIAPGMTEYMVPVGLAADDGVEDVENFVLEVDNDAGYEVHNSSADGFILDGDGPQLEIVDAETPEGDPGDDNHIEVVVQASYAPLEDVTFRLYSGVFGSEAEPGIDFEPIDEVVTLPAGETSVSTMIPIVEDLLDEDDELLPVYGEDQSAGDFGLDGGSAVLRILDDDEPGDDHGGAVPGNGSPTTTSTTSTTPNDDTEVLDQSTTRTAGRLAESGDQISMLWLLGALLLTGGAFLVVLAAARRSRRPAHLRR